MGQVFLEIRRRVTAEDAARRYGLTVSRTGKARCPWHNDRKPSLSFNRKNGKCYCFSCNKGGDAVDITARLLNLSTSEAIRRINADFDLRIDFKDPCITKDNPERLARKAIKDELQLSYGLYDVTKELLKSFIPDDVENPEFIEALKIFAKLQDRIDYLEWRLNDGRQSPILSLQFS